MSRLACLSVASRFPLLLYFHHHNPYRDLCHLNCILAVENPLIFFLQFLHRNRKSFGFFEHCKRESIMYFFISYTSNSLMHAWAELGFHFHGLYIKWTRPSKHCDIKPSQWGAELLAPGYGLQTKLIVLSFIQNVSDFTSIDAKFLSLFFCFSGCEEMFCLGDILKIGVITYWMVF